MDAVTAKYWTRAGGELCYFSPIVELWGNSLVTLLLPLASICVKLIGQKKGGGGWNWGVFGSFRPPRKPFALERLKHIPIPLHPPCPFSPSLLAVRFELPWIDLYMMLRNFVMIARLLFEAFVWARWSGFHLAGQLALFPGTDLLWWGSVTELRDPFVSGIGHSPPLSPHCAIVMVWAAYLFDLNAVTKKKQQMFTCKDQMFHISAREKRTFVIIKLLLCILYTTLTVVLICWNFIVSH